MNLKVSVITELSMPSEYQYVRDLLYFFSLSVQYSRILKPIDFYVFNSSDTFIFIILFLLARFFFVLVK